MESKTRADAMYQFLSSDSRWVRAGPPHTAQNFFIQSSKKYSLDIYYVPTSQLDAGDLVITKKKKGLWERQIEQVN